MSREKRVRDLVGTLPLCKVGPEDDLKTLAAVLAKTVEGDNPDPLALVMDGSQIIGTVNRADLLSALEPPYTKGRIKMEVFWEGLFTEQWCGIVSGKVKDFMRSPVVVDINDTLMKAAHVMTENRVSTVLVLDADRVAGTLSVIDLIQELVKIDPGKSYLSQAILGESQSAREGNDIGLPKCSH